MKCEVEYCIYNMDFECICDIAQINYFAMCEQCIFVSLDKDLIKTEKERQLQNIGRRCGKDTD